MAILPLFLAFFSASASAAPVPRRPEHSEPADSDLLYQEGVESYAAGRFAEALAAFEAAARRDPSSRSARVAADRVRAELAMTGAARHGFARPAAREEDTLVDRAARFLRFEDTLGDERELAGRVQALQGRIAQLLAEKRLARACRRRFAKDRELHALSRRLT